MFQTVELGQKVSKKEFKQRELVLREQLLALQQDLRKNGNFPVLVELGPTMAGFTYSNFTSAAGGDLRFYDSTQTRLLPYEIESWDTNGTSTVWVQVPELAPSNTEIYAFWGHAAQTNPPAYAVDGSGDTFRVGSASNRVTVTPPDDVGSHYDLHPDGERLLQAAVDPEFQAEVSYLHLVTDWKRGLMR